MTCATTFDAAGDYVVSAAFSGGANYLASTTSSSLDLSVRPARTTITLVAPPPAGVRGQPVALVAKVDPVPDGGKASFTENGSTIAGCANAPVDLVTGQVTCAATFDAAGNYVVSAAYSGDQNYVASTAASGIDVAVDPVHATISLVTPPPVVTGQSVSLVAKVDPVPDGGTVSFTENGSMIAGCASTPVDPLTGQATCTTTFAAAGSDTVSAVFSGDANYRSSASTGSAELTITSPVAVATTTSPTTTITPTPAAPPPGAWSAASFLNTPASGFSVDPNSSMWLAELSGRESYGLWVDYQTWTAPVYHSGSSTPTATVHISNTGLSITIPYTASFAPSPDTDAALAVIDDASGCVYEFEQFNPTTMTANAEATSNIETGTGLHADDAGVTGSDISLLGGLITPADVASGSINHALRYATPINAPTFVSPANRSDGANSGGIPEGEMMQLDPTLDLTQFNLTPYQFMVAKALQTYGAYNADSADSFKLFSEETIDGSAYSDAPLGLPWAVASHLQFGTSASTPAQLTTSSNHDPGCSQQG